MNATATGSEMETWQEIGDYFGLSGTILFVLYILYTLKVRFLKTRCTRGQDGSMHLDVSLNQLNEEDYLTIRHHQDLVTQLRSLHEAVKSRRSPNSIFPSPRQEISGTRPPALPSSLDAVPTLSGVPKGAGDLQAV
jgi:hypothetical protein